jgi:hypothetical protein
MVIILEFTLVELYRDLPEMMQEYRNIYSTVQYINMGFLIYI